MGMPETGAGSRSTDDLAPVRIGIYAADRLRREILGAYLDTLPSVNVVGRVSRYADVAPLCTVQRPGVMLLDTCGLDIAGAVATSRDMRLRDPDLRLVLVYGRLAPADLETARETTHAVVSRDSGVAALEPLLRRMVTRLPVPPVACGLSERQRRILLLLAAGHSGIEIAEQLGVSPPTVEYHKRRVYAKLSVAGAAEAVARAVTFGIIDGQPLPYNHGEDAPGVPEGPHAPLALVVGDGRETVDRVVATLIANRYPVLRDCASSQTEPLDGLRHHRGIVLRVLVDPTPDQWRIGRLTDSRAVVVHSGPEGRGVTLAALAGGAAAVLPARRVERHLVPMLQLVSAGYRVLEERVGALGQTHAGDRPAPPLLTGREYDILRSIARSHTLQQTARRLGIAVKTVENTQSHLFRKLNVRNRAEALTAAYSLGLLQLG